MLWIFWWLCNLANIPCKAWTSYKCIWNNIRTMMRKRLLANSISHVAFVTSEVDAITRCTSLRYDIYYDLERLSLWALLIHKFIKPQAFKAPSIDMYHKAVFTIFCIRDARGDYDYNLHAIKPMEWTYHSYTDLNDIVYMNLKTGDKLIDITQLRTVLSHSQMMLYQTNPTKAPPIIRTIPLEIFILILKFVHQYHNIDDQSEIHMMDASSFTEHIYKSKYPLLI